MVTTPFLIKGFSVIKIRLRPLYIAPVAALIASVGTVVVASAISASSGGVVQPISYTPTQQRSNPVVPAATALASALNRMSGSQISQASVGSPPSGPPAQSYPGATWFYARVTAPAVKDGRAIEALWQADLVQGAVAEAAGSSSDLHDTIVGSSLSVLQPDGSIVEADGGMGDVARGQRFTTEQDSAIQTNVAGALTQYGLTQISVRIFHARTPAIAVIASTSDPVATAHEYEDIVASLVGSSPRYEGYYLELRDSSGGVIVRASAAFRTGAGRFWVNPAYASDFPTMSLGVNR